MAQKPGEVLKAAREKREWTQEHVATAIGIPNPERNRTTISQWENGRPIPLWAAEKLAALFEEVTVEMLRPKPKRRIPLPRQVAKMGEQIQRLEEGQGRQEDRLRALESDGETLRADLERIASEFVAPPASEVET